MMSDAWIKKWVKIKIKYYRNYLKNNQEQILKMISPDIQPFVFGKLGSNNKSWYKRASYELV